MRYEGSPLPQAVRERMEAFFGVGLSTVRVHTSVEPERVGALALTVGEDIHFAPGQFDPFSPEGLVVLGHELTHVLQQRDLAASSTVFPASVAGTAGAVPVVVDAAMEAEADRLGRLAAAWRPGLAPAGRRSRSRAAGHPPTIAQPLIWMATGTGDDPSRYGQAGYMPPLQFPGYTLPPELGGGLDRSRFTRLTDPADTRAKVVQAMRFLFNVQDLTPTQEAILERWMNEPGDRNELKFFFVFGELAWALAEEEAMEAETGDDSLEAEKQVAEQVLASDEIAGLLRSLTTRFHQGLGVATGVKAADWARARGKQPHYYGLHPHQTYAVLVDGLAPGKQPAKVGDLIARLHDVKDLMERELRLIDGGGPPFVLRLGDGRVLKIDYDRMRYNVGTVDEADEWVRWMRDKKRGVWAGPSYTMRAMWRCAALVGATEREMTALGYSMYAYWCCRYPHSVTPIHRFHETFASAQGFGVPYLPDATVRDNYRLTWQRAKL